MAAVGAARLLGVNQPKVSALTHDKLDGFSVESLMVLLGRDVEIVVRKRLRSRAKAHMSVVAARGRCRREVSSQDVISAAYFL